MLGEEYVPEDAMGLTDAIRQAFKGSPTALAPPEIRERLQQLGLDITKYGNVLNSVHTVIGRLLGKGEIREAGQRANGQKVYLWTGTK
jgi:hypothetical protein